MLFIFNQIKIQNEIVVVMPKKIPLMHASVIYISYAYGTFVHERGIQSMHGT